MNFVRAQQVAPRMINISLVLESPLNIYFLSDNAQYFFSVVFLVRFFFTAHENEWEKNDNIVSICPQSRNQLQWGIVFKVTVRFFVLFTSLSMPFVTPHKKAWNPNPRCQKAKKRESIMQNGKWFRKMPIEMIQKWRARAHSVFSHRFVRFFPSLL